MIETLHIHEADDSLPDAGEGMCCMGAAVYGPGGCTCWDTVFDVAQAEPKTELAHGTRERMCADCAFRPDSPERNGDPNMANSDDGDLEAMAAGSTPFWCHQGMRRRMEIVHPAGDRVPCHAGAYAPPIVDGVPYKADGTPADICAGWAAHHRRSGT